MVTRFDRALAGRREHWIARLPQEDFCQALGDPPRQKYETDGGPGMAECMRLLTGSPDPGGRAAFAITAVLLALAATDGHAKNYSIFLQAGDAFITTPLYDVLSIFPYVGDGPNQFRWRGAELAIALRSKNVQYDLHCIQVPALARTGHAVRRPGGVARHARAGRARRECARGGGQAAAQGLSRAHLERDLAGDAQAGEALPYRPRLACRHDAG